MIQIRSLNEFVYCPRLFHLEYVQGLFRESSDTVSGSAQHSRSEKNRPKIRKKNDSEESEPTKEEAEDQLFSKTLHLSSQKLNITGKLDAIEIDNTKNNWAPVESKHSAGPENTNEFIISEWKLLPSAWPNDQIQLCAQGLLLRENGINSDFGHIYYRESKKRVQVDFSTDLIKSTLYIIDETQKTAKQFTPPPPLVDSPKCIRCSLNLFCLPEEINKLAGKIGEPRRIIPGRDDVGILYVLTQGARVSKKGESVTVSANGEIINEIPLKDISHAVLVGHVQMTTETLHLFLESERTVTYLTAGGRLLGTASPPLKKNVALRVSQYKKFDIDGVMLALAKEIVISKIENQRTIIRRNASGLAQALDEMKSLSQNCNSVKNLGELRGHEGKAGQIYFNAFPSLLEEREPRNDSQQTFENLPDTQGWSEASGNFFRMSGRNKRPPRDPVNAMLSFGYTLLVRDFVSALVGVGLDPYFGFYHVMEAGRPALSLDMMEPFRPIIVDSVVIRLINTGEIKRTHFLCAQTEVQMTKEGRSKFITAYERRMDELITHPVFGYRISYRRILDVECRLLGRFLEGEISEYKPLRTR